MSDTNNDQPFREGQRVRIVNNEEEPQFNGKAATLRSFDRDFDLWVSYLDDGTEVPVYPWEIEPLEPPTQTMTAAQAAADPSLWRDVEQGVKRVTLKFGRQYYPVTAIAESDTRDVALVIPGKSTRERPFWVGGMTRLTITRLKPPGDYETILDGRGRLAGYGREVANEAAASVRLDGDTQSNPLWDCEARLEAVTRERDDLQRQLDEARREYDILSAAANEVTNSQDLGEALHRVRRAREGAKSHGEDAAAESR